MNSKLKLEMDNPVASTVEGLTDEALIRAMAIDAVRLDSTDSPTDYLRETETPFGGE